MHRYIRTAITLSVRSHRGYSNINGWCNKDDDHFVEMNLLCFRVMDTACIKRCTLCHGFCTILGSICDGG